MHYANLPQLATVQQTINDCVENALFEGKNLFGTVTEQLNKARNMNNYIREAVEICNQNATGNKLTDCVNSNVSAFWNL